MLWVSYDVKSLYTSIPHRVAIMALEFHLSKVSHFSVEFKDFVLQVEDFLMSHNYFSFDQKKFLQSRGVSMGAKYSPSLANLVMSWWEEVYTCENPFLLSLHWYGRYNDDILIIWEGDVSAIPLLTSYLNNNPFNLNFVKSDQGESITFLDLKLGGISGQPIQSITHRRKKLRGIPFCTLRASTQNTL